MFNGNKMIPREVFICLFIFVSALVMRGSYLATFDQENPIKADAQKYISIAYNLYENGIYSDEIKAEPEVRTRITPGYPLFLSSLFYLNNDLYSVYILTLLIQAILGSLTACLTYTLARMLVLGKKSSLFCSMLVVIYPHQIITSGFVLTETLFCFLLMASINLAVYSFKNNNNIILYVLGGLIMGGAILTRPVALFIPFIILFSFFIVDKNIKKSIKQLTFVIIPMLLLLPWIIFSNIHDNEDQTSNFKSVFALGIYPDFIHLNANLKGFPHREDPLFKDMQSSIITTLDTLYRRAKKDPAKYLYWYTIGKVKTLWQWNILQGAGGAYIYNVKSSLYHKNSMLRSMALQQNLWVDTRK